MTTATICASRDIEMDGFALIEGVFGDETAVKLGEFLETKVATSPSKGGVRNLLNVPQIRKLADSRTLCDLVEPVLGSNARVVRGILFDKTSEANWKVPWHQDVTIAVSRRIDAEGFGPWSRKAGVIHVQPPAAILEQMISIRIHLDDCPEQNGALRVIPGSHRLGKMPVSLEESFFEGKQIVVCAMKRGGVLLMRPLLFHSSSAAAVPAHRRVIHFDYASATLPNGLRWAIDQS